MAEGAAHDFALRPFDHFVVERLQSFGGPGLFALKDGGGDTRLRLGFAERLERPGNRVAMLPEYRLAEALGELRLSVFEVLEVGLVAMGRHRVPFAGDFGARLSLDGLRCRGRGRLSLSH